MAEDSLRADYEILGVAAGASLEEVEAAWREQRTLWAGESLATYALAEGDERHAHVARLDEARKRIKDALSPPASAGGAAAVKPQPPPRPKVPDAPEPRPAPGPRPDLPELDTTSPGPWLRRCRERLGLPLAEVAKRTRIGRDYLEQIEAERFDRLPARVYTRGFVQQYARELGAPSPDAVAGAFVAKMDGAGTR